MTIEWLEKRFEDIEFYARVQDPSKSNTYRGEVYWMEFQVMTLVLYDDGNGPPLKFEKKESEGKAGPIEYTTDPDKAAVMISGSIKWDGCSHINFSYIHGCDGRRSLTRLGPLFHKLFDWAAELMPSHAENFGKAPDVGEIIKLLESASANIENLTKQRGDLTETVRGLSRNAQKLQDDAELRGIDKCIKELEGVRELVAPDDYGLPSIVEECLRRVRALKETNK